MLWTLMELQAKEEEKIILASSFNCGFKKLLCLLTIDQIIKLANNANLRSFSAFYFMHEH